MNVLSLFDGMSCGQQALQRAGINVNNYYASEIDKYGIKVTMANYPNTIQLGSVVNVDGYKLPKIDLLIGGSPCQSFSFAGKRKGMSTKDEQEILTLDHYLQLKSEGFEFEGQSYLFWEFMRLLNEVKPKYFLLENVEMGEKWEGVLTQAIGVHALHINSALVSAQNRKRIYFTNIGMESAGLFGDLESIIEQPKDKGILLKDILQDNPNAKFYLSDKAMKLLGDELINKSVSNKKSMTIDGSYYKGVGIRCGDCRQIVDDKYYLSENAINYINRDKRNLAFQMNENDDKSGCITAVFHKQIPYNQIIVHNTMPSSSTTGKGGTGHLSRADGKTYCLDTGNTNAVEIKNLKINNSQSGAVYDINNKSVSLCANGGGQGAKTGLYLISNAVEIVNSRIRRLTPIECERLQTVPDNYTNYVSDSQRYKMLGNGWTVDVIAHIFKYIK